MAVKSLNKYTAYIRQRTWDSPTVTTWGSFVARILSLLLVLPLVLNKFDTAEIALWYLFTTIITLQPLADMGFGVTFVRVIAFAMGGAEKLDDLRLIKNENGIKKEANWTVIEKIVSTMYTIYAYLTPIVFLVLAVGGSLALIKPISYIEDAQSGWISWIVILITTTLIFRGTIYTNYLQGINKIALLRRWQAIFALGAILTSFIVLILDGNILALVIANQSWSLINVIRNYYFSRNVESGKFREFKKKGRDKEIYDAVWPSAWRSGIGLILYSLVVQASGLIYAQVGSVTNIASYLLGLKVLNSIRSFSQAPFYSKIPLLSRLRAEGNLEKQISLAQRGMGLSYWIFVLCFISVGILAKPLLAMIGSNAEFVNPLLWTFMGLGYFFERYGAMHLQLYSTTNHIIWHIANGVSGIIYLVSSLILLNYIDVYAFPIGIILAQLGFYTWYSAKHSYRTFNLNFWDFEKKSVIIPLVLILIFTISAIVLSDFQLIK